MKKKMIAVVLTLTLILSTISATPSMTAYAKTKSPKLSRKKIVMTVGKKQKVKLKNASQKVKWTVAKKQVVKITRKSGKYHNSITIKGLKAGSTKVTAKCGKKKYKVKVTVKKETEPSISKTQQTTTKGMETTTSTSVETTTFKKIEESSVQETTIVEPTANEPTSEEPTVEVTTVEQLPDETTKSEDPIESIITEEETTLLEPTIIESTTEEQTTEELTTEEETTEPETTRETKLVAKVLNDGLTTDDTLQIKYYFDGPTDVVLMRNGFARELEIYEDGRWIELERNPGWLPPHGMGGWLAQDYPESLDLPLSQIYLNVKPGHYRYTRPLSTHFSYDGENPFGDSISVEFDVTCPEFFAWGQVKKKQIKSTDDLEITYTIITEDEKEYTYSKEPYQLYVWSDKLILPMLWDEIGFYNITDREYETMVGSNTIEMTIPLKEYYDYLSPGVYRYVHKIGERDVEVIFEIVEEEEIITTEENPESTTEEQTTVSETTIMESTSEEPTVEGATTEPETTRETKLVAEVLNDGLTTDDTLQIKYYFDGPTDVVLWTTGNPEILEIYENGQWTELEHNPEWIPPIGMGGLSQEHPEILELLLSQIYLNFKPGHYRYTRSLGTHYSYTGDNPFGDSISVEFDVTYPEFYVFGQVKKKQIKNTDDLQITYTIITEDEKEYTCSMEPCHLYVWSEDIAPSLVMVPWEPVGLSKIINGDNQMMVGNNTIEITIPLQEYYDYLSPGLYKYVHKIGERDVEVTFEIIAEEEID